MSEQIKRGEPRKSDWVPAAHHETAQGAQEFRQRMQRRMRAAQGKSAEVRTLFPLNGEEK